MSEDYKKGYAEGFEAGYKAGVATNTRPVTTPTWRETNYIVPDGLSYEEIYGSVVYQQNKKKE